MSSTTSSTLKSDFIAGIVVFLVALPLCLGIALASKAPMMAGLVAGAIGGLVIGALSGSHTSVSGPAAGLAAVVVLQVEHLGSFEAFTLAVALSGVVQILLGALRAGFIASFFPSSVIKGLLSAIGILLILKQTPFLFGKAMLAEGETLATGSAHTILGFHLGATLIGLAAVALLAVWDHTPLKKTGVPSALAAVLLGVGLAAAFQSIPALALVSAQLVRMPVFDRLSDLPSTLAFPDFSKLTNPTVYVAAGTVAIVATLETLLNLEAVDKLDPRKRVSPPNRELIAQGTGNLLSGLVGGLPITSVVVRGTVNISAGAKSRNSAIVHGLLLVVAVLFAAPLMNRIPLGSLAAILVMTGYKLAAPKLFKSMWKTGWPQFLPFIVTILGVVQIDILKGVVLGLVVAVMFILYSNFKTPLTRVVERHATSEVVRIRLSNQVSFFTRPSIERALEAIPSGGKVLIDARDAHYVDADVAAFLREYRATNAPARNVEVSLIGFKENYPELGDQVLFVDYSKRADVKAMSPDDVLELMKEGNARFLKGTTIERSFSAAGATEEQATPLAVVVSCSESPADELLFDVAVSDLVSVRTLGNVVGGMAMGSVEHGCLVAGAKLLVVLGHTHCSPIRDALSGEDTPKHEHLAALAAAIQPAAATAKAKTTDETQWMREASIANIRATAAQILSLSPGIREMEKSGQIRVVSALLDDTTGEVEFLSDEHA